MERGSSTHSTSPSSRMKHTKTKNITALQMTTPKTTQRQHQKQKQKQNQSKQNKKRPHSFSQKCKLKKIRKERKRKQKQKRKEIIQLTKLILTKKELRQTIY